MISRPDFFFALGCSVLFIHVPFFFLIQNSNGATVMPAWNWLTISMIFFINFIFAPFLFYISLLATNLFTFNRKRFLVSIFIAYLIVIQVCFYGFPSITEETEAVVILLLVPVVSIILYKMYNQVFLVVGATGVIIPISIISFLFVSYPSISQISSSQKVPTIHGQNDVIVITTEKLTPALMLNRNGSIRDEFPNLQRLAETSNIYTDLHTRTIHTSAGLNAILTGDLGTDSTWWGAKAMRLFRSRDILSSGSVVDFFSSGRQVHVYNDYTGERYCDEKIHHCVKIYNQTSVEPSVKIISAFYWEYFDTIIPKVILRRVKNNKLAFFEDVFIIDDDPIKYPKIQFEKFLTDYEKAEAPVLMIMHSFMTDGGFSTSLGYSKSDMSERETKKWNRTKVFDYYIGQLMNKMEKKGKLKESLLLVISDTGSDDDSMRAMTEPNVSSLKYNENISKIFGILHRPNQEKGNIIDRRIFQENIFQKLTGEYEHDESINENLPSQIALSAKSSIGVRLFKLNEKTNILENRGHHDE